MKFPFYRKLFVALTIAFGCTAVAGTLLHECGHYIAARSFNYPAKISYAFTHWDDTSLTNLLNTVYNQYPRQLEQHLPYPTEARVALLQNQYKANNFRITMAGPLQTMLTGCLGLLVTFICRRQYIHASRLSFLQWLPLFLSLFWTRQTFNLFFWLGSYVAKGYPSYRMDEVKIAQYLHWPIGSITTITGIIGLLVSIYINFIVVPLQLRFTFITAGLLGGLGGFLLWVNVVGPALLPL